MTENKEKTNSKEYEDFDWSQLKDREELFYHLFYESERDCETCSEEDKIKSRAEVNKRLKIKLPN